MSSSPCFDPLEMFKKIHILFLLLVTFSFHISSSSSASSLLEPVTDERSKSTSSSSNGMARSINGTYDTSNVEAEAVVDFVQQQQDEGQLESFLYRPYLHLDREEKGRKEKLNERKKFRSKRSRRGQHQPQVFNIGAVLSSGAHVKFLEQVKIFSFFSPIHLFLFPSFILSSLDISKNIESNRHPINRLRLSLLLFCVSQLHVLPFSPSFSSLSKSPLYSSFSTEHFITLEGKEIQL